jgi:glucose-6-phosphate isomerase
MVIGSGATRNYTALLLFLAGTAAAGVAVYYTQVGGRWAVPTAVSLMLMIVACGLVAARRDE